MTREFDVVVYGASGFTGKLVAEHIAHLGKTAPPLRWALAGRNAEKLAAVRAASGAPDDTTLLRAESHDAAALADLARRARVVLTTVGPYQLYGSPLVAACAAAGTDYVDLCGEPVWMRKMIDAHDSEAKASGARIVLSCGFDSIPFDLGVAYLQSEATKRFGAPCPRVKGRVRKMKGTFSGGTAESFRATMAAAAKDPNVLALLRDPFALTPGAPGPKQPSGNKPEYDGELGSWAAPFVMAAINTRNVHRSNLLRGYPYGARFPLRRDDSDRARREGRKDRAKHRRRDERHGERQGAEARRGAVEGGARYRLLRSAVRRNRRRRPPHRGRRQGRPRSRLRLDVEDDY